MTLIACSNIITAFDLRTIGTKVKDPTSFMAALTSLVESTDFNGQRVPGQAYIACPELKKYLSAGAGKRTNNPEDYVPRFYRGRVSLFLKRAFAGSVEDAAVVVHTKEAYLNDPDVKKDPDEFNRIFSYGGATHVLVAILASAGPKAPLSPYRLVHNLAGGNNEALTWTADEIRAKAKEALDYDCDWCVVAD